MGWNKSHIMSLLICKEWNTLCCCHTHYTPSAPTPSPTQVACPAWRNPAPPPHIHAAMSWPQGDPFVANILRAPQSGDNEVYIWPPSPTRRDELVSRPHTHGDELTKIKCVICYCAAQLWDNGSGVWGVVLGGGGEAWGIHHLPSFPHSCLRSNSNGLHVLAIALHSIHE